ncbi:helix-turn-helix transcriptional regulator [Pseudoxanthobacter sp. M-2]|uniref:helix-turn-helix domain-containing protein n=1 Tax=Pseudoxanthobacter sp. M-2 TaxID=3078754 RepID=UPI0038FCB487
MTLSPLECRSARALLGLSRSELAHQSKVAERTISDFESGRRSPINSTLEALRRTLEAHGVELFGAEEPGVKMKLVRNRGERLSSAIIWIGRQWAVTDRGIEARDGTYFIQRSRVWEENEGYGWLDHMREKEWVDISDFKEALMAARRIYANK